jgi:hypothetical protein
LGESSVEIRRHPWQLIGQVRRGPVSRGHADVGIEGAQLLTNGERIFIQWLGNLASSPFQTSTTVLMQSALERKWTVTSTGDFLDLVLHDMLLNGWIGGFFSLAHAYTASRPAPGGTGPGDGGGGDSGGGRGGPGGGGRSRGSPTLRGMGAAGPAGENALPANQAGETLTGMGAAGPAGENDLPANQTGKPSPGSVPSDQQRRPARCAALPTSPRLKRRPIEPRSAVSLTAGRGTRSWSRTSGYARPAEHSTRVQDEINHLQNAHDEHHGIPDEDPTDPGR